MQAVRSLKQGERVRARILLPFTLVLLFVIGAFVLATYVVGGREQDAELANRVRDMEKLFARQIENDASMMQAALIAISRNEAIRRSFMRRDRESLLQQTWPLFDTLRENNNVTHFYITEPDRVNFLRVHQPDQSGDTIDRATTRQAAAQRTVVRGVELGPLGTLTLRVVLPWYRGDQLIGYLELGEEIENITDEIRRILGVGLLAMVDGELLGPPLRDPSKRLKGHFNIPERIGSSVIVAKSIERIPEALLQRLREGTAKGRETLRIEEAGKEFHVTLLPFSDISQRVVGRLAVVHDVTGVQDNLYQALGMVTLLSVAASGVVFIIFYIILGRVERDALRQREVELKLTRMNTEHQKVVQLEKLSAMGLMVGEIAHQLNNPLVGVVNMAQLAERKLDAPDQLKGLLGEIGRAGKDCHSFVRRMLDFTKISCFELKESDLNNLVNETLLLSQRSIGRQVRLEAELPEHPTILTVDPVLIRHALFNLLANAIQASPAGSVVKMGLFPHTRGGLPGWCLAVRDQGSGIDQGLFEKIFTPFFTTRPDGTGLGLPVVQHVAILHEGVVWAENAEEGGAVFHLWLPQTGGVTE
jgi:signal transduction histidine kinase